MAFILFCRAAAEEWPEAFAQFRRDEAAVFLGAEDTMKIGTDVGHGFIQPSLRDFGNSKLFPALKRRAIFGCSFGTANIRSIYTTFDSYCYSQ